MKLILKNTIFVLVTFASFVSQVNAESISASELQQRFNKAFSVFHEDNTKSANITSEQEEDQDETFFNNSQNSSEPSEDYIVKESNKVTIEKSSVRIAKKLVLPSIPNDNMGQSLDLRSLGERTVSLDLQNSTLKSIVKEAFKQGAPEQAWSIRWRLKDGNKYIINEKINLTAELNLDSFMGNMVKTVANITGIQLSTKVFYGNRIIIITDSF
ncbi:MAG: hypothetical protein GY793_09575 [Proteobacteria bacterium]|nr:hypothetical protein [Pseudomonadota bacterium]